jgi:hypothetical protein
MSKANIIAAIGIILNRGTSSPDDTNYFEDRNHNDLVEEFTEYLEHHTPHLGPFHPEITQALNDRGVDLILEGDDWKIGFQIKSHYDVRQDNFAANVKRQLAESFAHGIDKWYLLICSPLSTKNENFSDRITHLVNEISSLQTKYVAVYSPRATIAYFNNAEPIDEDEFRLEYQRRSFEQTTAEQIQELLRNAQRRPAEIAAEILDPEDDETRIANYPENLLQLNGVLEWDLDENHLHDSLTDIHNIIDALVEIPLPSRRLFNLIVSRYTREGGEILWPEIRDVARISDNQISEYLRVLEKYGLVDVRYDREDGVTKIVPLDLAEDKTWDPGVYWSEIRRFAQLENIRLSDLIVNLRFDLLDEPSE